MKTIIVDGLGAMGASIAQKLHESNNKVLGIDNDPKTCEIAKREQVVDETITLSSPAILQADLIILAGPIAMIKTEIISLKQLDLDPETIVMDIGSTKVDIMRVAADWSNFVGGHPMVGTDQTGICSRNKDMFVDKSFFLVGDAIKTERVESILQSLQAKFQSISAPEHDRLVTSISDLPHVVAFALVNTIDAELPDNQLDWQARVAGGFIDTTRIAQSNPELWSQILISNSDSVVDGIDQMISTLEQYRQDLITKDSEELISIISRSKKVRQKVGELHD